ncbi:MAG: hypothetical protein JSR76_01335 [Verrucomicrobia bacterium]|nr:hypothetical protein [Verrucomicrobiota bacterium]
MVRYLFAILVALVASSCAQRASYPYAAQLTHHENGTPKPKVALVPILDHTSGEIPPSLSQDLTENLFSRLFTSGKFYLTFDFEVLAKHASLDNSPFLDDIDWIKESASPTEFLVFIELVEHKMTPNSEGAVSFVQSYNLDVSMRVKVLDLRASKPRVILQELFQETFYIPWRFTSFETKKGSWQKAAMYLSLISSAHTDLLKKISTQIEDYILLAKWQ